MQGPTPEDVQKDINAYKQLAKLNKSEELDKFFELLMTTVSRKALRAFMTDEVQSYEDFKELKGEITSYLFPIQEIRGADAMAEHIKQQLDEFYPQQ